MMGSSHGLSGVAVGVWTSPIAAAAGGPVGQVAWIAAVAGFALAPDLDAPGSTAARVWGPVSQFTARALSRVAGGHRGATHDIIVAPATVAALGWVASLNGWASLAFLAVAAGLAQAALDPVLPGRQTHPFVNTVGCAVIVAAAHHAGVGFGWLPVAAAAGVAVHIVGDALTTSKVPVPFTGWQARPPAWGAGLFKTGTGPESVVCAALLLAVAAFPFRAHVGALIEGVIA